MSSWTIVGWILVCLGVPAVLYCLHRLGLRLEDQGYVYYLHKKPSGSAAGSFVALQRALEPQSQHVLQVEDERKYIGVDEAAGRGRRGERDPGTS